MKSDRSSGISGRIEGVNLSSFLQMIEMEQKTCTVNVFVKKNMGQIFFYKGVIVDAATAAQNQAQALYDILSWKNFIIEVEENRDRKHNVINLPLMHVIMESARQEDESKKTDPDPEESPGAKNIPLKTLTSRQFCLEIGINLLIDFEDLDLTLHSALVGIEHGKYLLLKAPVPLESFEKKTIRKKELVIKSLYRGTIYAFRSRLMALISEPSRLMFIQYPDRIEHHELRAHKRFRCSIVAQARVNEAERGGVIENISMGGCRCTLESFSSDPELTKTLLNRTIPFRCRFPGTKKEVRFIGQVKNTRRQSDEVAVGVAFLHREDSHETRSMISNYIQLIEYSSENV